MTATCGCCEGIQRLTPAVLTNRPGSSALSYRVGTHATFLATMEAGLSSLDLGDDLGNPLAALGAREPSDIAVALLDAWATVADVLSFYQERIANEGYLRTATERRSILELSRLVGYEPRPGVSASAHLSFTLEDGYDVTVPAGTAAKTVPGPGETPQTFETKEELAARVAWNRLRPRLTRPQAIDLDDPATYATLYLEGTPNMKPGARLLLVDTAARGDSTRFVIARVQTVERDEEQKRTTVTLHQASMSPAAIVELVRAFVAFVRTKPVSPSSATTKKILTLLVDLEKKLADTDLRPSDVARSLEAVLPSLAEIASKVTGANVAPWARRVYLALNAADRALLGEAGAAEQALRIADELGVPGPNGDGPTGEPAPGKTSGDGGDPAFETIRRLFGELQRPPSAAPPNRFVLSRSADTLRPPSDSAIRILSALRPSLRPAQLYGAWSKLAPNASSIEVYALRVTASAFGQAAQPQPAYTKDGELEPRSSWTEWEPDSDEDDNLVFLDAEYSEITAPSYAVIERPDDAAPAVFQVVAVETRSRSTYGLTGKTTMLALDDAWWEPHPDEAGNELRTNPFRFIERTVFRVQSELLPLADAPRDDPVEGAEIELDALYDGLAPGRFVVVVGERLLAPVSTARIRSRRLLVRAEALEPRPTVPAAELALVAGVEQRLGSAPGDTAHTWLTLANRLAYRYERGSATIHGNVVGATHGESRSEVLGSGEATQSFQRFPLRQPPLTYVAAPTPSGTESSLRLRVNELLWHEARSIAELKPDDRSYLLRTDDDGKTSVVFGDGKHGARLPTGIENLTGGYRSGIGKAGNAEAERISQLATKPLGVKEVVNPLPATGGADRDSRDQARRNTPLAVTALDRLVSVQDYEDFTRLFAGIGKASAAALVDGRRRIVHVTIAGVDDIPIAVSSDLYRNLLRSLHDFGDPHVPVVLAVRELLLLVVAARVRLLPDYAWSLVEPRVRAALVDVFGFERRELGQDGLASEVVSTIQRVPGVDAVDLDTFDAIPETGTSAAAGGDPLEPTRSRVVSHLARREHGVLRPAELALLDRTVPDTLLLSELPR
jgi:hypothetical protein